jgi:hypothetical protein
MKRSTSITLLLGVFIVAMLSGCSGFGSIEEPLVTAPVAVPEPTVKAEPTTENLRPAVPRVKQAQVIGVVRELVNSGCAVQKVATTDGIHYSQLIVTCGDVQQAPAID